MKALRVTDESRPALALYLCSTATKHPLPRDGEYVCVRPHDRPLPLQHSERGEFLPTEYMEVPACIPIEHLDLIDGFMLRGKDIARIEGWM